MTQKHSTSFRISQEAHALILRLTKKLGLSQTSVLELAVRKLAEAEGLRGPKSQQ